MMNNHIIFISAIYCTRPIVLENLSSEIEVRLTSYVRSSSEVEVYFRTTSSEEVRDVKDLNWTHLIQQVKKIHLLQKQKQMNEFKEYKYSASGLSEFTLSK